MGRDITSMMKGLNVAQKKKSLKKITKHNKKDNLSDLFEQISLKPREVDNLAGLFDRLSVSNSSDMNFLTNKLSELKVNDITKITRKMKNMSVKKELKSRVKVLPSQKYTKTQVTKTQMDDLFKQADKMRMMEIDDELDAFFGGSKRGGGKNKPSLRRMKATIYEFKKSKSPKMIKGARGTSAIKKKKRVTKKKVKSAPKKQSPSSKSRSYAKKVIKSMKKLTKKSKKTKRSLSK